MDKYPSYAIPLEPTVCKLWNDDILYNIQFIMEQDPIKIYEGILADDSEDSIQKL